MTVLIRICLVAVSAITFITILLLYAPVLNAPDNIIVNIEPGYSVEKVALILTEEKVISSPFFFEIAIRLFANDRNIKAGTYRFYDNVGLLEVVRRVSTGDYRHPLTRLTIPEGFTVREVAMRISTQFPHLSAADFIAKAKPKEGYIFPDTYYFDQSVTNLKIIQTAVERFETVIEPYKDEISASGRSLSDIIIMASLIEREARQTESKHMVSGILWNRLDAGMLLQVDAVFGYIFNRSTFSPTFEDLKVDSPYNTYRFKGLPPGPISNPGLRSILAALRPTATDYMFYLTGNDNRMHYARTYKEHTANKNKFLR